MNQKTNTRTLTYNYNALDVLKIVVLERNWHKGKLSTQLANRHKKSIMAGTIKYSTAIDLLDMLGWQKVQEEVWENSGQ